MGVIAGVGAVGLAAVAGVRAKLELERLQEVELELEPKVAQDLELKRMVMVLLKANISSAWDIRMLTTRTATISADNDDGGGDDDDGGGGGDGGD
uniref:Uncharacterized protein n=1 Tax=Globodera pallida TaxID=36090 RepID=A0A183C7P5_GLOPA